MPPTAQLLVQQDHVMAMRFEPLDAGRTEVQLMALVPDDTPNTAARRAHWAKIHQITRATVMEDFALGAEIQAGFASRGNPSHLFGRFEGALDRFHRSVVERIG